MLADFDRKKEQLWFPILQQAGFSSLEITQNSMDQENAIDASGTDVDGVEKYFALRIRDEGSYSQKKLQQYKQEFTIRYSRPTGVPVEWQKLFELELSVYPDFFCYGWFNHQHITDFVILDVRVLKYFYREGYLQKYESNTRRNTDGLRSELVFIPMRELLRLPYADRLIADHSKNHPVFR